MIGGVPYDQIFMMPPTKQGMLREEGKTRAIRTIKHAQHIHSTTRVSPSLCLGFYSKLPKNWENASHLYALNGKRNPTVYHMSRTEQSPGRSLRTKVNRDSPTQVYRLEYHPVIDWVLFQDSRKFGKTHPMCWNYIPRRIQWYITCPDWCNLLRGDVLQS